MSGIKTMLIKTIKETSSRSQLPGLDANANRYTMCTGAIHEGMTEIEIHNESTASVPHVPIDT